MGGSAVVAHAATATIASAASSSARPRGARLKSSLTATIVRRILHDCAGNVRKGTSVTFQSRGVSVLVFLVLGCVAHAAPQQLAAQAARLCTSAAALRVTIMERLCGRRRLRPSRACATSRSTTRSPSARCRLRAEPLARPALRSHRFPHRQGAGERCWTAQLRCTGPRRKVDLSMPPTVADFGFDLQNRRHLTAQEAGIATADSVICSSPGAGVSARHHHACAVGHRRTTLFLPVAMRRSSMPSTSPSSLA